MKNIVHTSSSGKQFYATLEVNSPKWGTGLVMLFISLELIALIAIIIQIPLEEWFMKVIPICFGALFAIGIPVKYLLWNLYGTEDLVIGNGKVEWSYKHSLLGSELNEAEYNHLETGYEKIGEVKGEEVGKLLFFSRMSEDGDAELIHKTSVLIAKKEIEYINCKLWEVLGLEGNELIYS